MLEQLKLPSQNKPILALLIHDIPLRNIVEPLIYPRCWQNTPVSNGISRIKNTIPMCRMFIPRYIHTIKIGSRGHVKMCLWIQGVSTFFWYINKINHKQFQTKIALVITKYPYRVIIFEYSAFYPHLIQWPTSRDTAF